MGTEIINVRNIVKAQGTNRMDVFVKYMYVEAILNNSKKQIKSACDLYSKMQDKRNSKTREIKRFNNLINDIKENGFKDDSIIELENISSLKLCDGSHRLACCLAFNVDEISVRLRGDGRYMWDYGLDWFERNEFSKEEITFIRNFYNKKRKELNI